MRSTVIIGSGYFGYALHDRCMPLCTPPFVFSLTHGCCLWRKVSMTNMRVRLETVAGGGVGGGGVFRPYLAPQSFTVSLSPITLLVMTTSPALWCSVFSLQAAAWQCFKGRWHSSQGRTRQDCLPGPVVFMLIMTTFSLKRCHHPSGCCLAVSEGK